MCQIRPIRPIRIEKETYEEYLCLRSRFDITGIIDRELSRKIKAYFSDFLFRTVEDDICNTAEIEALCSKFNDYIYPVVTKLVKDLWENEHKVCDINYLNLINSFIIVALSLGQTGNYSAEVCYDNLCKYLVALSVGHVKLSMERETLIFNESRVTPYKE